jgi:hypothetical protein
VKGDQGMKIVNTIALILFGCIVLLFIVWNLLPDGEGNQNEPTVSIEANSPEDLDFSRPPKVDEKYIQYHDSIEESLAKTTTIFTEPEFVYMRKIHEVVKLFENDQYAVLFYTAVKDEETEGFNASTFRIRKTKEGGKQYALLTISPVSAGKNKETYLGACGLKGMIAGQLRLSDFTSEFNVDNPKARFIWSICYFEEIHTLKIEGEKPTEIIPYKRFDGTGHFWYYTDLKSDKPSSELKVEVDEPED